MVLVNPGPLFVPPQVSCRRVHPSVLCCAALGSVETVQRQRFDLHKKIARWTWPLWIYVSVTGVIVYLMLYQLYTPNLPSIR